MFLIRNVFHAKPGKAKDLVSIFKKSASPLSELGITNTKIMTDVATTFWTVVIQSEVENLNDYFNMAQRLSQKPELAEAMSGYMEFVEGGHREIYRVES
jgi:hypothetical protein